MCNGVSVSWTCPPSNGPPIRCSASRSVSLIVASPFALDEVRNHPQSFINCQVRAVGLAHIVAIPQRLQHGATVGRVCNDVHDHMNRSEEHTSELQSRG